MLGEVLVSRQESDTLLLISHPSIGEVKNGVYGRPLVIAPQ